MGKSRNCEICAEHRAFIQWSPYEAILMFSDIRNSQLKFESIRICEKCRSRVMKMFRGDGEVFEGCQNIEDIKQTVRKDFKL